MELTNILEQYLRNQRRGLSSEFNLHRSIPSLPITFTTALLFLVNRSPDQKL